MFFLNIDITIQEKYMFRGPKFIQTVPDTVLDVITLSTGDKLLALQALWECRMVEWIEAEEGLELPW